MVEPSRSISQGLILIISPIPMRHIYRPQQNPTHVNVYVPESDGAVRDETRVEGVKVGDALHVGDEDGDGEHEDEEDDPDHARVEPLVVLQLVVYTVGLDLSEEKNMTVTFSIQTYVQKTSDKAFMMCNSSTQ